MNSAANKAVFLSYASQDAEAAKRICDALRAAGVEVWFDQNELVGGDAWDAKIRGQISSCALFVPLISANTQARLEGYFRLEWKLAAQRTHTMADEKAFLLPILLDATRDAEAKAPAEFKAVQWTKLPGGEAPPAFAVRVRQLLGGEQGPGNGELEAGRPRSAERGGGAASPVKRHSSKWWWVLPIFGVTMALVLVMKESRQAVPPAAAPAAATSELQKLLIQARAIVWAEQLDELTREDLALAESLLQRAVQQDPLSGEAWTLLALCSCENISLRYDVTQARKGAAHDQATRALRLAPDANEARFAWAMSYRFQNSSDAKESVRLHREVAAREPTNKFILRQTGRALESTRDPANLPEAISYYERAAALPGGDALALRLQADSLFWELGRYEEALAIIDRAIALRPQAGHLYGHKAFYLMSLRADLGEARAVLAKMPPGFLLDDFGALVASSCWMWSREPDRALAVLAGLSHDDIDCRWYTGPKALLTGDAHQLAGRLEAARADWRIALQRVEQKLAGEPGAAVWLGHRAQLLAKLGERAAAEQALQIYEQVRRLPAGRPTAESCPIYVALGRTDELIEFFLRWRERGHQTEVDWGALRHDPALDPIRRDPRIASLLKEIDAGPARATSVVVPSVADDKSVAVLAFANLSDDKANEYFSDGISEELLNVLAKIPGLKVSARTSAFYFKGKEVPVPEIARQLGVAYVVEGSVRKQGDKVRITAQLIKADGGFHVWSDTFTRDLKDIFAVQDEIAGLIAKNLSVRMGMTAARPTIDIEAYQEYLAGRALFAKAGLDDLQAAVGRFAKAVALEPKFTAAWVQLASAHTQLGRWGGAPTLQAWAAAHAAIERAVGLEPDSPDVLLALGWIRRTADWDWRDAEQAFRRALQLRPDHPETLAGAAVLLYNIGKDEEAFRLGQQAVKLDPLNASTQLDLSLMYYLSGQFPEAERTARRAMALAPGGAGYHSILAWSLIGQKRYAEAETEARLDTDEIQQAVALGLVAIGRGQTEVARAQITRLEMLAQTEGDRADLQNNIAWIAAGLGEKNRAFAALEKAQATRDPSVSWLRNGTYLQLLFDDPRWDALLRKVGLADDQLK